MPRFTTDITEIPDIFEPVPQVQPQGRQRVNIHTTIRDALKAIETNHLCGERDLIERYTEVLVRTLQQWKDDLSTPPKYLAHILEEQYLAEDGYSQEYRLSKLNDQDSAAGQALQKACEVTGCSLFISALMRTKVEVTPEGSDFEEYATSSDVDYETCWELDHIVDMSGQLLCYGAQTSQDEILDLERFYDFVEDIEDGVALSVFLIVPHVHIFLDILADATPNNMQPLLTYFRLRYHDEIAAQEKHTTVHRLCTRFIEREEARLREGSRKSNLSRYKHPVVSVIDATLFMDDIPLLKRSLRCLRNVAVSVFVELRDRVEKIPFAYLVEGLDLCIEDCKYFDDRFRALQELTKGSPSEQTLRGGTDLEKWIVSRMEELITGPTILVKSAYGSLMKFVSLMGGDEYFIRKVVPVLVSNTEFTPFIMVFLNALFDTPGITEAAIRSTFQEVLPRLRVQYNLENWSREAAEDDITKKIILVPGIEYCPYTVHLSPIEGQELAKFISHAIHFGHYEDVISIIRKFTNELDYFSSEDFVPTIIPFLQGLASTLSTDKNGLLANSDYQKLFTYALDSYLGRCIEKEPAPPSDWSRPKISCLNSERWSGYPRSCTTCDDINKFLEDSQRTSFELQTGKDNHRHITSGLLESEVDCAAKSIKPDRFWKIRLDKTTKQYEEAKRKWGAESKAAETHLKAFDQNALKELLGNNYDAIMALKKVRLPSAPVPSASTEALAQPLQSGSANVATHMETPSASTQENVGRNAAMSHGIDPTDDSENEVASKRQRLA